MRYVKFRMESNEEGQTDEFGIVCKIHRNWETYIPTLPRGLGHDLLDHAANERGFLWQEIAALGASTWRTEFGGNIVSYYPWFRVIVNDMISSFKDNEFLKPAPKVKLDEEIVEQLDELLAKMRPEAIDLYDSEFVDFDEDELINPLKDDEVWKQVCGWFKFGYARSQKRFDEPYEVQHMFEVFKKTVGDVWQSLLNYGDTGREFTLAYDVDSGFAEVRGFKEWE